MSEKLRYTNLFFRALFRISKKLRCADYSGGLNQRKRLRTHVRPGEDQNSWKIHLVQRGPKSLKNTAALVPQRTKSLENAAVLVKYSTFGSLRTNLKMLGNTFWGKKPKSLERNTEFGLSLRFQPGFFTGCGPRGWHLASWLKGGNYFLELSWNLFLIGKNYVTKTFLSGHTLVIKMITCNFFCFREFIF